jgi:hypothetical protein
MIDVRSSPGEEVVEADDLVTFFEESLAEV